MEQFEMVQMLAEKAGVTTEQAQEALEACGWDMFDALLWLERSGEVQREVGSRLHTDRPMQGHKAEEGETAGNGFDSTSGAYSYTQEESAYSDNTTYEEDTENRNRQAEKDASDTMDRIKAWLRKALAVLTRNYLTVINEKGANLFTLPLWIPVVVLVILRKMLMFVLITLAVLWCLGYRFMFSGPDMNGRSNGPFRKMEKGMDSFGTKLSSKFHEFEDKLRRK